MELRLDYQLMRVLAFVANLILHGYHSSNFILMKSTEITANEETGKGIIFSNIVDLIRINI